MHDRVQAAALFRQRVGDQKLIEGWIEGPCAEAADLRGINRLMTDFYDDPVFVRELFEFTLAMGLEFARAQVEAGVDLIGVGDAAASLVGPKIYEEFVLPYERRLVDGLHAMGTRVRLHICGNIRRILPGIGSLGCEMVDIDSMVPLEQARQEMGPAVRLGRQPRPGENPPQRHARRDHGGDCRVPPPGGASLHRAAGCEVPRDTPEANVLALRPTPGHTECGATEPPQGSWADSPPSPRPPFMRRPSQLLFLLPHRTYEHRGGGLLVLRERHTVSRASAVPPHAIPSSRASRLLLSCVRVALCPTRL